MAIYLDNAATSFPKPESVYAAIDRANRHQAVSAGRGRYQRASDLARLISQTRNALAKQINAADSSNISFAFSGTDALSTAILGFVRPGDHVVSSVVDHTSVLRPLWHIEQCREVSVTLLNCDASGVVNIEQLKNSITPSTRLVCLTQASNVTGCIEPIDAAAKICHENGIALLVDAAQTIGHTSIDVQKLNCDFLAAPGHKGLMGSLGTGFLYVSDRVRDETSPLRFGGTGSTGTDPKQPKTYPEKFESGNTNVAGIAGLLAGLQWLDSDEFDERYEKLIELHAKLVTGLSAIEGVSVYGGQTESVTPTVSFNIGDLDCQTAGMLLDSQFEIECRTGLHCAPLIHEPIGSAIHGGTVRFSPGLFTTPQEIQSALDAVEQLVSLSGDAQ